MTAGYWQLEERLGLEQLVVTLQGFQPPRIQVPKAGSTMPGRLHPLLLVASTAAWRLSGHSPHHEFGIQLHDEDPGWQNCLRFDAEAGSDQVLLPDPYALGSHGYRRLRHELRQQPLPPWRERLPIAFWRGATTGSPALTLARLGRNRRYQLCCFSRQEPSLLDARLTNVVQARDAAAGAQIRQHLMEAGLLAAHCPAWMFGLHRYLIEIDGNVNSWGLLWKLLSGSCILRVGSAKRQWYHHKLEPFVHVVPVARDLSDLGDQLHWCRTHPDQCEAIACAGQALAFREIATLGESVLRAVDALVERP